MGIIKAIKLAYEYKKYDDEGKVESTIRAVDGVDLDVKKGDFVAILGHNGSGKSTLAKHLNALIAFLENNLNADGTVNIPEPLRMYMGGKEKLIPKK